MVCGVPITIEALVRRVVRMDGSGLLAISLDTNSASIEPFPCGDYSLLSTLAALVSDGDNVRTQYGQGSLINIESAVGCEDSNTSTSELFGRAAYRDPGEDATRVMVFDVSPEGVAVDCETELTAEQMVRSSYVVVGGQPMILVVQGDGTEPMDCDISAIGLAEIVKRCMVRISPSLSAWRYIQGA
jgi:hypothetical protein